MGYKVLIVEDDPMQREMTALLLKNALDMSPVTAASGREALRLLAADEGRAIQAVLADHLMPEMDGLELLQTIAQQYPLLPVIMLTGNADIKIVIECMKSGAADFLTKPPEPERLRVSIRNAVRLSGLEREVTRLKRQESGAVTFDALIGHDRGLAPVIRVGRKAAAADIPVLLLGETGVGKEVFARAIHGESRRTGRPFVAVNCGAIPEHLVESTLFGHEKGAFTGAIARAPGRFREAEGGTLFLDEVGELPQSAQVKLLRVLQQREISPVGGGAPVPVNVRILSATNRDLEKDVAEGKFREDLYFRLNVLSIRLPSLRDRREDIPDLAAHFVARFSAADTLPLKDFTAEALDNLRARPWPGNVRELENVVHRAMVLSDGAHMTRDDLPDGAGLTTAPDTPPPASDSLPLRDPVTGAFRKMEEIEQDAMRRALAETQGNVTRAAALLGIAKSTFYRKTGPARTTDSA